MKILSSEQMRQWDAFTIDTEKIESIDLMERAAAQCTNFINENNPALLQLKIFVVKVITAVMDLPLQDSFYYQALKPWFTS